jgi:2-isopropylmalate synthase
VAGGARQIECTINGLGERAGNTALEEVVMAMKVRGDIMPFTTPASTPPRSCISRRRVATVSGFNVQPNKAIVGKNAFAHESGIHQDGMLKSAETFEIMRPEDVGWPGRRCRWASIRAAPRLRAKLKDLGFDMVDNQLNDLFVRFKALADRKKEVFDDDLIALGDRCGCRGSGRPSRGEVPARDLRDRSAAVCRHHVRVGAMTSRPPPKATARWTRRSTRSRRSTPMRRCCSSTR